MNSKLVTISIYGDERHLQRGLALSPIHADCILMEPAGIAGCERLQARGPYSIRWFKNLAGIQHGIIKTIASNRD